MTTQERWEAGTGGGVTHIIKRPRLTKILDASEARIILLCAPAGYGKTTLAREWVATRSEPVLWYSGGPAMADVAALAVDLAELFAGPESELVEKVRFLATRGEDGRVLAKALVSDSPPTGTTVVVDDYQHVASSSAADELFAALAPETSFRLLLASRLRPAWIDARSVVYRDALLLAAQQLAFTQEEGEAVLPNASAVLERAQGWPALIGLAAFRNDQADPPAEPTLDELYDFVAADLFDATDEMLRRCLFTLALGGDASWEICRQVLGEDAESLVERAADHGFIAGRRDGPTLHPLLREFLLTRMRMCDPIFRRELLERVITALADAQAWDTALAALVNYPSEDLAARALSAGLKDLLSAGRIATVDGWVSLARANDFRHPIFALAHAEVALRHGNDVEAGSLAREAAQRLEGDLAARASLTAARAAHHADDLDLSFRYAQEAQEIAVTPELRTEALWLAFANAYERDPGSTGPFFDRLRALTNPTPEHSLRLLCAESFMETGSGSVTEALALAKRAVALAEVVRDPLLRTNALNMRAHLLKAAAAYDEAVTAAEQLVEEAMATGLSFVVDHAQLTLAGALIGLRSISRAKEVLRELAKRAPLQTHHVRENAVLMNAQLRIATGDLDRAELLLAKSSPTTPAALHGEHLALRGLVLASRGIVDRAATCLAESDEAAQYVEAQAIAVLARAVIVSQALKPPASRAVAAQAVSSAAQRGASNAVVIALRAFPELARLAVQGGTGSEVERILLASNDIDLGRRAGLKMAREFRRSGGLSVREREVYALVRQGCTNQEIARTLFISESTAKVHVRHIFEKLGVHNRAEAAATDIDA